MDVDEIVLDEGERGSGEVIEMFHVPILRPGLSKEFMMSPVDLKPSKIYGRGLLAKIIIKGGDMVGELEGLRASMALVDDARLNTDATGSIATLWRWHMISEGYG